MATRSSLKGLLVAALLISACVGWLAFTQSPPPDYGRNFFGHWRTPPILVALFLLWAAGAALLATRSRRAVFAYVLGGLLLGTVLVLLEIGTLLGVNYGPFFGYTSGAAFGSDPVPNLDLRDVTYQDLAHSWNLPTEPVPFHFRSDRHGFRNETDREAADLYVLGDSVVVAALLPFETTLTSRLEQALARPVMNIALIGIGPERELDLLRESKVPLAGRLVLHIVTEANDLGDSHGYRHPESSRPSHSAGNRSFTRNLIVWLQEKLQPVPHQAAKCTGWIGDQPYLFHWVGETLNGHADELPQTLAAFTALRDWIQAAGGTYATVLMPSKYRVLHELCRWPPGSGLADPAPNLSPLRAGVARWASDHGVPHLDLTAPMQAAARAGRIPYFPGDTHPNQLGHELAASQILAWPPLREWAGGR